MEWTQKYYGQTDARTDEQGYSYNTVTSCAVRTWGQVLQMVV